MSYNSQKPKDTLNKIINLFKEGDLPAAMSMAIFPLPNVPLSKWSFLNRTLCFMQGTCDARGFSQWKDSGRYIKKHSKAIHILAPNMRKIKVEDETTGEETSQSILKGFRLIPVFKAEDTDGTPLTYENISLPDLPLLEVANAWGINVKAIPGSFKYYGYFSPSKKEIALATPEEKVFFHELAHAAHYRIESFSKNEPVWKKEIIAELCASALEYMTGRLAPNIGESFSYIERYAKKTKKSTVDSCIGLLSTCEKVLNEIFSYSNQSQPAIERN